MGPDDSEIAPLFHFLVRLDGTEFLLHGHDSTFIKGQLKIYLDDTIIASFAKPQFFLRTPCTHAEPKLPPRKSH